MEAAGAKLCFPPPFSPDLSPIEKVFSTLKALPRKDAKRTRDALWDADAIAIEAFTRLECANFFTAAGAEPE